MAIYRAYFGIDSHLRTTTTCAPAPEDGAHAAPRRQGRAGGRRAGGRGGPRRLSLSDGR